jgi:hypothetical protein
MFSLSIQPLSITVAQYISCKYLSVWSFGKWASMLGNLEVSFVRHLTSEVEPTSFFILSMHLCLRSGSTGGKRLQMRHPELDQRLGLSPASHTRPVDDNWPSGGRRSTTPLRPSSPLTVLLKELRRHHRIMWLVALPLIFLPSPSPGLVLV